MNVLEIARYSLNGNMPPSGNLEDAQALLAFPFGLVRDIDGAFVRPGATNEALISYILENPILRKMTIVYSEELQKGLEGQTEGKTLFLSNFTGQNKESTSYDYARRAHQSFKDIQIGKVAIVAFSHHLPRAVASSQRVGINTVVPDLRGVGDFDTESSQPWTRNANAWAKREAKVIPGSFLFRQI